MTLIDLQPWIIDAIAISFTTQLADPPAADRTFTCLLRGPENGESLVLSRERKFFCPPSLTRGFHEVIQYVTKSYVEPTSIECFREIATNKIFIMIWWNRVYYKSALRSETSVIFDRSWQGKYLSWGEDRESVFFEAFRRTHTPWGGADLWRCEYLVFGLVFRI